MYLNVACRSCAGIAAVTLPCADKRRATAVHAHSKQTNFVLQRDAKAHCNTSHVASNKKTFVLASYGVNGLETFLIICKYVLRLWRNMHFNITKKFFRR